VNYDIFNQTRFWYPVKQIVKVYDGDSPTVLLDRGFGDFKLIEMRIEGIDTPEQKTVEGKIVTRFANEVLLKTYKLIICKSSAVDKDKFGRILGDLILDGQSYAELLMAKKLARPYRGEAKIPWTKEQLDEIRRFNG
jgi:endonuclease YncB( thermonuclease family)